MAGTAFLLGHGWMLSTSHHEPEKRLLHPLFGCGEAAVGRNIEDMDGLIFFRKPFVRLVLFLAPV
jgi:hypothetical protein